MKFNWPYSPGKAGALAGLIAFVVALLMLLARIPPPAFAQHTSAVPSNMGAVAPGNAGTLADSAVKPLAVNHGGELLAEAGMGRYESIWPTTEVMFEIVVLSKIVDDTARVRIKGYTDVRSTTPVINYMDTVGTGEHFEIPKFGKQVAAIPYGIVMAVAGDLSTTSKYDTSYVYIRNYARYNIYAGKYRMFFYGSLTSSKGDTSQALRWEGRTGLSLALLPGRDSCAVKVEAQVFAGGSWLAQKITLTDSTALDSAAWTTLTPSSVMTGDSIRIITTPEDPFKVGVYMPLHGLLTGL